MPGKEKIMTTQDTWCSVDAYFDVKPDQQEAFELLADRFVEETNNENGIRYYGWSFNGTEAHCRQGYIAAEGFLEHAQNVIHLFKEALTLSDCTRLAIHGPEDELEKLRGPMAEAGVGLQYFALRNGFRR
jgi:hypothetical protein